MSTYSTNEFRSGLKILLDGDPYTIVENEFVKPGKGQAFNRVKIKNLKNSRVIEKTFKSGDTVEAADISELEMQFLYSDGTLWHFMDPKSYEQYEVNANTLGDSKNWLQDQDMCTVLLWNGAVLSVVAANFVNLKIIETDPGLRGDTSGGGNKPAIVETGATVKIPLFVQTDDIIKIDTRTGEYVSRVKD